MHKSPSRNNQCHDNVCKVELIKTFKTFQISLHLKSLWFSQTVFSTKLRLSETKENSWKLGRHTSHACKLCKNATVLFLGFHHRLKKLNCGHNILFHSFFQQQVLWLLQQSVLIQSLVVKLNMHVYFYWKISTKKFFILYGYERSNIKLTADRIPQDHHEEIIFSKNKKDLLQCTPKKSLFTVQHLNTQVLLLATCTILSIFKNY